MRYVAEADGQWLAQPAVGALRQLAVDGKVLRGSGRPDGKPWQLRSAVTHYLRLTLDPIALEEQSNEIPALTPLLRKLNLADPQSVNLPLRPEYNFKGAADPRGPARVPGAATVVQALGTPTLGQG